jgi:protein-disulfide isomerase-like protein with CxxC motif
VSVPPFAVTWDYRCPFAANAHDHVVEGLLDGAGWEVTFVPFCQGQRGIGEDGPDIWDTPERDSGLLALQAGVVVRDHLPERFLVAHRELFAARHVHGRRLRDPEVVRDALDAAGVDGAGVLAEIATGAPLETVRKEHEAAVAEHEVFGVPTFISGGEAAFVRLMRGAGGDAALARRTVERIVDLLVGWPELNEFKHTAVDR